MGIGRGRPGESRYKRKRISIISFGEFKELMEKIEIKELKSLTALLYYLGLRVAEIVGDRPRKWKKLTDKGIVLSNARNLPPNWMETEEGDLWYWKHRKTLPGILKEDITLDGDTLRIYSKPLKHGKREGVGQLELDIHYPYVNLIIEQWQKTKPGEKIWNTSTWKVWNLISSLSEGRLYPHAFRLSRATRLARNPDMSIADMQQWFGWARASTADSYILPARSVSKVKDSIREELESK